MATRPSASCSAPTSRPSAVTGLGTAPPNEPECRSTSGPWKSTWQPTSPRMPIVVVGTSRAKTPVSVTTTTSGASRSRRSASSAAKCGEPDSSSPSMRKRSVTAGVSRPVAARCARRPSRWNSSWPLSSAAPRANSSSPRIGRLERRVTPTAPAGRPAARRGARRPARPGAPGSAAGHSAKTAGAPGVSHTSTVGKPSRRKASASHSALRRTSGGVRRVGTDRGDPQPRVQVGVQQLPVGLDEVPFRAHPGTVWESHTATGP